MEILKWEYTNKLRSHEEEVSELGKQGWEAVGIDNGAILFKRPCGKLQMREVSQENKQGTEDGYEGY